MWMFQRESIRLDQVYFLTLIMSTLHSILWRTSQVSFLIKSTPIDHYKNSANDVPRRHFHNKFVKDYKQWTQKYLDFVHYQIPLPSFTTDGFSFPGEFVGQYGVYDAVKHLYSQSKELKPLLKEESLYVNKKFFAVDLEKAIDQVKVDFRQRHNIP
jgi:hypothetical protein